MQPVRPPSRAASYSKQHDEESGLKAEYIPNLLLTRPELVKTISGNNVIPQIAPSVDIISKTYQPASNQLLKKPSLVNLTPYLIQPQPQTARKPAKRHSQLRPAVNLDGPYVPTPDQYNQTLPHQRPQNVQVYKNNLEAR